MLSFLNKSTSRAVTFFLMLLCSRFVKITDSSDTGRVGGGGGEIELPTSSMQEQLLKPLSYKSTAIQIFILLWVREKSLIILLQLFYLLISTFYLYLLLIFFCLLLHTNATIFMDFKQLVVTNFPSASTIAYAFLVLLCLKQATLMKPEIITAIGHCTRVLKLG